LIRIISTRSAAIDWETAGNPCFIRAISRNGQRLLTTDPGDSPTKAEVRDVRSGTIIATINLPQNDGGLSTRFVATFSHDGRLVATGSHRNAALVWNAETGARIAELKGHKGFVIWIAFSHNSRTVVTSAYNDNAARSWRVETGEQLHRFPHLDLVTSAIFHPTDPWLLTTSWDGFARLWNIKSGQRIGDFDQRSNEKWKGDLVRGADFSEDGKRLLTASDSRVMEWDVATFHRRALFATSGDWSRPSRPFYANEGRSVLATTIDRKTELWDAESKTHLRTIDEPYFGGDEFTALPRTALLFRDRFLISTNPVRIWGIRSDRPVPLLELKTESMGLFGADGRLLTTDDQGNLRCWWYGHLLDAPEDFAPRGMTAAERERFFLDPLPPSWCITGPGRSQESDPEKWAPLWPYDTDDWRQQWQRHLAQEH
jgi:WD40 repeat protein